jgi:hypothetical protein
MLWHASFRLSLKEETKGKKGKQNKGYVYAHENLLKPIHDPFNHLYRLKQPSFLLHPNPREIRSMQQCLHYFVKQIRNFGIKKFPTQ